MELAAVATTTSMTKRKSQANISQHSSRTVTPKKAATGNVAMHTIITLLKYYFTIVNIKEKKLAPKTQVIIARCAATNYHWS